MTYSIRQIAAEFGLTLRALRFYEGKGLLSPTRRSGYGNRTYSENDRLRVAEIVKGARYGLSLQEIKQYLADGPTGPMLNLPNEVVDRQALWLDERVGMLWAALEELQEFQRNRKAAGATGGKESYSGTSEPRPASPTPVSRAPRP